MAYGLKYFCEYKRDDQETTKIEIEEEGYTLYPTEVKMVSCQVVQGNGNANIQDVIKGTKVNLGIATNKGQNGEGFDYNVDFEFENIQTEQDFREFYTQDETRYRVTMYREDGVIFFRGFILPDLFLDEYVDYQRIIQFTASDRLNKLVDIDIKGSGALLDNRSIANLMITARDSVKLDDLEISGSTRMKEKTGGVGVPTTSEIGVNRNFLFQPDPEGAIGPFAVGNEIPRNFDEILRNLAKSFFSNVFQWKGRLYFYSIVNSFFDSTDIATYEDDPETYTVDTINTQATNISGKMLSVPTIEGQPTARRARVRFQIGSQLVRGQDDLVLWGNFEMNAWQSMTFSGGFRWRLRYWTYIDCDWTNQASRGPDGSPTDNYVMMHRQSANVNELEAIESTNRGEIVTPQQLLRFSLKYNPEKTKYSANGYDPLIQAFVMFKLIIRNESETWYLERNDANAFVWTQTDTFIRIRFNTENFRRWNDFLVDNLVPPITGSVHVRLYNTFQPGSTARFRFHTAYDDVEVSSRANEQLENADLFFTYEGSQPGYSSFADDYDVELGDFNNSFSESSLIIDGRPTQFWSFNGQGELNILTHVARLYGRNITQPRMTINCRVRMPDLDITKGVMVDGVRYRINHWSLDDAKNIWSLELHKVYI